MPHGAELTAAGQAFLDAVRTIPDQIAAAALAAARAGRGETGSLRVGFTGSAAMNPVVPGVIRAFRRRYPEVALTLSESNSTGLATALRSGSLDVAFLRPGAIDAGDMHVLPFADEPMLLTLPASHALVADDAPGLRLTAVRDEVLVLTSREIGPTLFDAAVEACRAAGFSPRLGQPAPQIASVLALVAAEQGVSIVPGSMRQLALSGVAYREIVDVVAVARLSLVQLRSSRSPAVQNFNLVARNAADVQP